jgi:cell division FtsZ-interacting protein ZapD
VITLKELERQRAKVQRIGRRLESRDWKYLNLVIRVLKENVQDRVRSLKITQQLDLILAKIHRIIIPAVISRGARIFQQMLDDPNYVWAHRTIEKWRINSGYCLTAGLKDLGVLT